MKTTKSSMILMLIAAMSYSALAEKTNLRDDKVHIQDYTLQLDGGGDDGPHGFMAITYKYHQSAMFVLWCPMTDFAVSLTMYFKYKTQWYADVHTWIMFVVDIGTILVGMTVWIKHMSNNAAAVQIFSKFSIYIWFKFVHGILVFFLMIGVVIVHCLGGYVKWYGGENQKLQPFFWKAKRWHKYWTKWVYWMAKIMIFSGCYLQIEEGYPWPWKKGTECPYYDVLFIILPSISLLWFLYQFIAWGIMGYICYCTSHPTERCL